MYINLKIERNILNTKISSLFCELNYTSYRKRKTPLYAFKN